MEINTKLWMLSWLLSVARLLGVFLASPYLGKANLPGFTRNGVVMILAGVAVPIVMDQVTNMPYDALTILGLVVKEMILGFFMGYFFSIPFWAASSSGFWIDLQRGVMSAQLFSPSTGDMTSPLGQLIARIYVVLLFSTGGFLMMFHVILLSYKAWPVDTFMPHFNMDSVSIVLQQFDLIMYTMVLLAGPIIIIMFIVEIGGAIIGRDIPELNIFLLLMPIKSGIALLLLVLYIAFVGKYFKESFLSFGETFKVLDLMFR